MNDANFLKWADRIGLSLIISLASYFLYTVATYAPLALIPIAVIALFGWLLIRGASDAEMF